MIDIRNIWRGVSRSRIRVISEMIWKIYQIGNVKQSRGDVMGKYTGGSSYAVL